MPLSIATPPVLSDAEHAAVRALAGAVEHRDGEPPLSDQALAHLRSPKVRHVLANRGGRLVGYAQSDGTALEIAAEPEVVDALLEAVDPPPGLRVWSHGTHSPLGPLLAARGYRKVRVLHQLRRPLTDLPDEPSPAADVTVRTFEPGADEDAWLRVNAAAFAHHAEQGAWTREDLESREAEPWFDPAGFFLAERAGRLVGFHWTKIHEDGTGEVYVLGIDPAAQGLRLGPALLIRGLRHLAERGCPEVLLYVDDDNDTALRLYERTGFHRHDLDVQWAFNTP